MALGTSSALCDSGGSKWALTSLTWASIHILGPTRGPVRIRTGLHARPDATHLQTAVRRLAGFPQPLEFAATSESREMEALFTSSCPGSSCNTVLTPAPGFRGHFIVIMAHQIAVALNGIPAEPGTVLHSQASFAPGDVFIGARDRNYIHA